MLGFTNSAIAGGMENMDRAPYLMTSGRRGYRMGDAQIFDLMLMDGLNDAFSGKHSGWHTGKLPLPSNHTGRSGSLGRTFSDAVLDGASRWEVCNRKLRRLRLPPERDQQSSRRTAHRPDTTMQTLSKLKPAFRKDGTITAGNAPGLNTAASAMIVADRAWSEKKDLKAVGPPRLLWCGSSRAGNVWAGSGSCGQACTRTGWLENRRYPAHRNQ